MQWVYVAIGGALGSVARFGIGTLFNQTGWPFGTWLVNLVGSFLIGLLFAIGKEKGVISPHMYIFLATGVMGGFTTFSSFSLEVVNMALSGRMAAAFFYSTGSLVLGMLCAYAGIACGRYLAFAAQ